MQTLLPFKSDTPIEGAIQMLGYQLLECKQGSPEWLQGRAGLTTASTFGDAIGRLKKSSGEKKVGDWTDKAEQIAADTALELIVGKPWGDVFQNFAMRRGSEEEWNAREAYMRKFDVDVTESGIAITPDRQFGYSTDGEIERKGTGPRGGIEIKTPLNGLKLLRMLESGDTGEYEHQMQGGMWICDWEFIDYIMWIPEKHKVDGDGLYVKRIHRDPKFIDSMVTELLEHRKLVWKALCTFKTPMSLLAEKGKEAVRYDLDEVTDVTPRVVADTTVVTDAIAATPVSAPAPAINPAVAGLFS